MGNVADLQPAPKKRRPAGHLHKRKDGRWEGVITVPNTGTRKHFYGQRMEDVEAKMTAFRARMARGESLRDSRMKVGAYLDYWLEDVMPGTVRDTTAVGYRTTVECFINPPLSPGSKTRRLDGVSLADFDPVRVQAVIRHLGRAGKSPATQAKAKAVLSRAMADAVRLELIPRNPCRGVRIPTVEHKAGDALTDDEAKTLIAAVRGHRFEAAFLLCLMVGLRRGEVLGLRWSDIDFETRMLTVSRAITWQPGKGLVEGPPKTKSSRRTVTVPGLVLTALETRRRAQTAEAVGGTALNVVPLVKGDSYVFSTATGGPISPRNFLRAYHGVTESIGLGKRRLHGLRHSTATLLLEHGVDLSIISELLGHASFAITADLYAEVRTKSLEHAADTMDRALSL